MCMDSYSENEIQNVTNSKYFKNLIPNGKNRMMKVNRWERVPEPWKSVEIQVAECISFR